MSGVLNTAKPSTQAPALGPSLPNGGWSYYAGEAARIEPTCWAILALAHTMTPGSEEAAVGAAVAFLRERQRQDGLLVEPESGVVNFGWNALALVAVAAAGAGGPWTDRVRAGLLRSKGIRIEGETEAKQNDLLQAWSWTDGTFSWIEPTVYGMLALKKVGTWDVETTARLADAEAMVLNRVCESGGWNYGNAQVFAQDLRPYVSTTALALLAMQDKRDEPAVVKSLDWLTTHALTERSAMALSLAAICLTVYGKPVSEILAALAADYQHTAFLGNTHLAAMAVYASALPEHRARAFTV